MDRVMIFFLSTVCLSFCATHDEDAIKPVIAEEVMVFFESFALEGQERGIEVNWDVEGISGEIIDSDAAAVGRCITYRDGSKMVSINRSFWMRSTSLEREFVIFHELGHCLLQRSHDNTQDGRGMCQSIMNSGENICIINYNSRTRERYLDELFL